MQCPDCQTFLSNKATSCACGWKQASVGRGFTEQSVPCAFEGCLQNAVMRVRSKTGWANVCIRHDVALVQKDADDWMKSVGLDRHPGESSRDWWRRSLEYLKANAPKTKRVTGTSHVGDLLVSPRQREPGDDDEEIAA